MPEFCEGVSTWEEAAACPNECTQHPCYPCKISYWQEESPLQLAKAAIPGRYAQANGGKRAEDLKETPPPAGISEGQQALDHAIVRDERGLPFLHGPQLEPLTRKQRQNMGSEFDRKRKMLADGVTEKPKPEKIP